MVALSLRLQFFLPLSLLGALLTPAEGAEDLKNARFTGAQSCASTSCHGGGTRRNEAIIYEQKDRHAVAYGILAKGTSLRIAEALKIQGDPGNSLRCNVCHSPMQSVPLERLAKDLTKPEKGVSCEACHGPAEPWLRFHTRPDANYQQSVALGLRDLNDLYGRANTCVACHLNVEEEVLGAGHPELFFELDKQAVDQPPHYRDERPFLGPRSWLTGQAAALREVSWKLTAQREARLLSRWKALLWLLRKTAPGKAELPETEDFAATQAAADRLARSAARAAWTPDVVAALLREYVSGHGDFAVEKSDKTELRRRAEVLVPAIDSLWRAFKQNVAGDPSTFEIALKNADELARQTSDFRPAQFARILEQLEVAFERLSSP